ncbi:hypothetical protein [Falsirhodobacter xinxiangensis]|uniref:hypothetical protein n=1 Tax=Falsirhodobacter xinxiangensis TaxID=2530049 RepID=UPI0010A9CB6F|nr:hypothetical protein [Rhodobacter xinxiangensis]
MIWKSGAFAAMLAGAAAAQEGPGPALVDTSSPFAPGASEVLIDTPNVFFWSRYQQGERDGWHYRLYPDGRAVISRDPAFRAGRHALDCAGAPCAARGLPPEAEPLARDLARWAEFGGHPPPPAPPPIPAADAAPVAVAESAPLGAPTPDVPPPPDTPPPGPRLPEPRLVEAVEFPEEPVATPGRDTAPPTPTRRFRFDCSITGSAGLTYRAPSTGNLRSGKLSGTVGCNIAHRSGLSLRLSFTGFPIASQRSASDSNFSYALSWRAPMGFLVQYASYSGRLPRQAQDVIGAFGQGGLRISRPLPAWDLGEATGIDALGKLNCSGFAAVSRSSKSSGGITCGVTAFEKLTLRATANIYSPGDQDASDADYTYSASYAINDKLAVEYANYAGNRFAWNGGGDSLGLRSGSIRMTYRFSF